MAAYCEMLPNVQLFFCWSGVPIRWWKDRKQSHNYITLIFQQIKWAPWILDLRTPCEPSSDLLIGQGNILTTTSGKPLIWSPAKLLPVLASKSMMRIGVCCFQLLITGRMCHETVDSIATLSKTGNREEKGVGGGEARVMSTDGHRISKVTKENQMNMWHRM